MRLPFGFDSKRLVAQLQTAIAGLNGQRGTAMRVHVCAAMASGFGLFTADTFAGRGGAILFVILRSMGGFEARVLNAMGVVRMGSDGAVRMGFKSFENGRIPAQAAGAYGHSNHENPQELARCADHALRKAKSFKRGQAKSQPHAPSHMFIEPINSTWRPWQD
jgi:hypothetical protein